MFSDPNDPRRNPNTRQQLETLTFKTISTHSIWGLRCLTSLRTVSLCFIVGEELLHINLLYGLTDIRRGVVEFVNAKKWLIREQNPEDAWSIQYACFTNGDFNKGKDNEEITYDRRRIETDVTDIDSRAPGLKQGDERFVEVSIRWPIKNSPAQESSSSDQDDSSWTDRSDNSSMVAVNGDSDESDIEPVGGDSHEIQTDVSSDQAEENVLTENSEHDDISAEVESNSNVNDESPIPGLNNEDSRDSQEIMATYQERDDASSQSSSEEESGIQSSAQRSLRAEFILASRTLEATLEGLARLGPMTTRDDRSSLLHTSNGDDQIQDGTDTSNGTAHAESSQHTETSRSEHRTETEHVQQNLDANVGELSRRTNETVPPSSTRPRLPEISNAPNPYTEEEMESYESWQQSSNSRTQEQSLKVLRKGKVLSPPRRGMNEGPVQTSLMKSTTKTPANHDSTTASQDINVFKVVAGSFLLMLLLAMLEYLP